MQFHRITLYSCDRDMGHYNLGGASFWIKYSLHGTGPTDYNHERMVSRQDMTHM